MKRKETYQNISQVEAVSRASHFQYDEGFPREEQMPRSIVVRLEDVETPDGVKTIASLNGQQIGATLTDNSREDDGYRYHDVFHLAHASILGWSPCMRSILKCKRKSDQVTDEVEDGGRATAIEEGIVALVFAHARERNFFEDDHEVDAGLLRTIKSMTAHLEVSDRTMADWEGAILSGFSVWRDVRSARGGVVQGDLRKRSLTYSSVPALTA